MSLDSITTINAEPLNTVNTTPATTSIVVEPAAETAKLFRAHENLPSLCEKPVRLNRRVTWNRQDSKWSKIRAVGVLCIIIIVLLTSVVAVFTGDTSKLIAATVALNNVAQAFALNSNGTSHYTQATVN